MNDQSPFDPLKAFFRAQNQRPDSYLSVDLEAIPPFLRSLLVKDGTVTSALSAYYLQPVETTQIAQETTTLNAPDDWLDLAEGAEVIERQVILTGTYDDRLFLFAQSRLALQRLPEQMRMSLKEEHSNLGQLLRSGRLETLREGLWFGREQLDALPQSVTKRYQGEYLSRKYRILSHEKPLMTVIERFPIGNFES